MRMTAPEASPRDMLQQLLQFSVDVKLEQNTKGYNVSVHVYEFATPERIDSVVENAVYAMKRTHQRIAEELSAGVSISK